MQDLPRRPRRVENLNFAVSAEEKRKICAVAAERDVSISHLVRSALKSVLDGSADQPRAA